MKIKLDGNERNILTNLHRAIKDSKKCDRIKTILLLDDGYSQREVSKILLIDEDTLIKWKKKFINRKSNTDWLGDNYIFYNGRLTSDQEGMVIDFVKNEMVIDSKQVIAFIQENSGIEYSTSGIRTLLHRLGFVYKKTTLIPSKYDQNEQEEFNEKYENMLENLSKDEIIFFIDGVHPQHNTHSSGAWILKGENKFIKSNTGRRRINIQGAYDPRSQKVIVDYYETINAQSIIHFFKLISRKFRKKKTIFLFSDNARYYRNAAVKEFLKTSRIELLFLPPYSPNLNLIERLWKYMRKKVINNIYYQDFSLFNDAVFNFFQSIDDQKDELRKFIGNKLHLFSY